MDRTGAIAHSLACSRAVTCRFTKATRPCEQYAHNYVSTSANNIIIIEPFFNRFLTVLLPYFDRSFTVERTVERKRYGAYFNRSTEENGNVFLSSTVRTCASVAERTLSHLYVCLHLTNCHLPQSVPGNQSPGYSLASCVCTVGRTSLTAPSMGLKEEGRYKHLNKIEHNYLYCVVQCSTLRQYKMHFFIVCVVSLQYG